MKKDSIKKGLIGQELIKSGLITPLQLEVALKEQRELKGGYKEHLGEIITSIGFVDKESMMIFLEQYLNVPHANLEQEENIDPLAVKLIPEKMARYFKIIPLKLDKKNNKLIVAMENPSDIIAIDTLKSKTGYDIEKRFAQKSQIKEALIKLYEKEALKKSIHDFIELKADEDEKLASAKQLKIEAVKTPVIEFVDQLLYTAIQQRASDIHIEPCEKELRIRFRVDGILQDVTPPPKEMQPAIITRLKLLGDMDIAEHRLPQDGRFKFIFEDAMIDIRMASTPVAYGEKIVLRILDSSTLLLKMEDLGMNPENMKEFRSVLKQAYGMVLVTGPTGSGKTTTLYSALSCINTSDKNIVSIEDPIEYRLSGINQIQTKYQIGLTFASALRTVLRQDPDIIMIGEIRDLETLENAVKAALTGHLVLSTIHTNNAPSVIMRLMHMGLEPYLISSCVGLVIAQRLVRKICDNCKEKLILPPSTFEKLAKKTDIDLGGISFYKGKGCDKCNQTGYRGRTGLYEFLVVTKKMKEMILEGTSENAIREAAKKQGMQEMFQAGLDKVNKGITTIEEVLRVTVLERND